MNSRPKYKTKQRELLLDYLMTVPGVHMTANDLCERLKTQGTPIGQSTVYRQLESLVEDGLLNKYIIDTNSPACFEYVEPESHADPEVCFHFKCEKCGKLIHLHCDELSEMQSHLNAEHHLKLDSARTVFYGLCEQCTE